MTTVLRRPIDRSESGTAGRGTLARVMLAGAVVQAALLAGLIWPLWIGRSPRAITEAEPLATMLGANSAGVVRFTLTIAIWIGGYLAALRLSRDELTPAARRALIALPFLFAVSLSVTWPAASKDLYHYVMEGRTVAVYDANPLVTPPAAFPDDPLAWIMSSWEWEPSRYGPLWALVAALPAWAGGTSLVAVVLWFKAINLLAYGGVVGCTYLAVRRLRPEAALPAYVFIAWNPLLLFESAASAHNDTLMLAFTALALYGVGRRAWTLAFPALAAAALVKFVTGLLGPLILVWAWRNRAAGGRERLRLVVGVLLGMVLTVLCYAPFWEGWRTFDAPRNGGREAINSPGWLVREGLERAGVMPATGRGVVSIVLLATFLLVYAAALRAAAQPGSERRLWRAGFVVLAAYVASVAWWFWPWYLTWLLVPAALTLDRRLWWLCVVWTSAAMLAYLPINFRLVFWGATPTDHMPLFAVLTVFVPALAAIAVLYARTAPVRGDP